MSDTDQVTLGKRELALPRKPQRRNGREKYEKLLDTLESLLSEREASEITLADLSEAAGVPTASIYHFFPSKDAALTALAERYFDTNFRQDAFRPAATEYTSWQELVCLVSERALSYYQSNSSMQKLRFGPNATWAIRDLIMGNNQRLAEVMFEACSRSFLLPDSNDWHSRFLLAVGISDAFWAMSYSRYGRITGELVSESKRATIAYLKMYIGELLERRTG
ncbi:TetR/AcrR family transcriptional regulator [Microbulbifer yueqingensis]|uniref:Transcriptional regulator, TetR family n=1 Tax=Microbulbifer yueqingensis TaxID=658219 RepID=A0A1G8XSW1_9GAMM|nr:TetR/AcrR family transcriptional regulator [Microbulbifer yueqingensis]SDJ93712.1 transcriptional regulator, TetR family [Microbulbifer yueqingensis]